MDTDNVTYLSGTDMGDVFSVLGGGIVHVACGGLANVLFLRCSLLMTGTPTPTSGYFTTKTNSRVSPRISLGCYGVHVHGEMHLYGHE